MVVDRKDSVVHHFDNRVAQIAGAAFGAVIVVIGLAGLAASSAGSVVFYILFGVYTIVRSLRSSRVVVDGSTVTTRSMARTRRYPLTELRSVEVTVGRTGIAGFGREHLVFHRVDGQDVAFKELNSPPPKAPDTTSTVRRAAACINDQLARR